MSSLGLLLTEEMPPKAPPNEITVAGVVCRHYVKNQYLKAGFNPSWNLTKNELVTMGVSAGLTEEETEQKCRENLKFSMLAARAAADSRAEPRTCCLRVVRDRACEETLPLPDGWGSGGAAGQKRPGGSTWPAAGAGRRRCMLCLLFGAAGRAYSAVLETGFTAAPDRDASSMIDLAIRLDARRPRVLCELQRGRELSERCAPEQRRRRR